MNAIGHHFHIHIVYQINTLYCSFIFILTTLVKTGHRIIEMRGQRIT